MRSEKPLFSIIVPVYNEENYIREALESILAQTDPDWEAVLVDDGSTDSTPGILDEYVQKDERFRVFHKPNGGTSTAINKGIQEAKGEWFCWLSGDDLFHPDKLAKHRRWIKEYPEIGFFFTGFWLLQPDGTKVEYPLEWLNLENPAYHVITLFRANYVIGISICIQREVWLQNGAVDDSLRYAQDFDIWLRLMLKSPAKYLPDRTCTVRYHPGQDTSQFPLAPAFDASKVIIRTLNEYSFRELFPLVNLNDSSVAIEMLNRTIDFVAGEPRSNIYMLGIHPLLHFRILEWCWDPKMDPTLREEIRSVILNKASNIISQYSTSPFGLLWQATCAALNSEKPLFRYFPYEAKKIGELNYYIQNAKSSEITEPLRNYLGKIDRLVFEKTSEANGKTGQIVLLLPPDISVDDPTDERYKKLSAIWQHLSKAGFFVLLVGKSKYAMGLVDGLLCLGTQNVSEQRQLLATFEDLDMVVALSHPERLTWVKKAEHLIPVNISDPSALQADFSKILIGKIDASFRKKIRSALFRQIPAYIRKKYYQFIPPAIREKAQLGQQLRAIRMRYAHYRQLSLKQILLRAARKIYHVAVINPVRKMELLSRQLWLKLSLAMNMSASKKQPVVFIAYALWGGGVEKVLYELAHGLDPEKYTVIVVYLQKGNNPIPYDKRITTIFLQLTEDDFGSINRLPEVMGKELSVGSAWSNHGEYSVRDAVSEIWPFVWALRKLLEVFSINTIFIPMDERNTVILWLSQLPPYRKVLASQHYPYSQAQPIRFPTEQMRKVKEALYLNALRAADAVTFDSEGSRWDLINNFGASPQRTFFMPNLINCASVMQQSQQPLPDHLQRLKRRTIFTQVARMAYEKHPLLLVEACDLLRKSYDDFVVFFIGNGPLFEEMRQQINQKNLQDHILLLDEQANPYPYVASARALLLTSRAESSPLVLVEAMLCGAVPISTDCIAGPRELLKDGRYGLLVPPNDPQAFADAMYQIASDDLLHNRLRENASAQAWRYNAPRAVGEWEELISYVAQNNVDEWVRKNNKDKDTRDQ